MTNGNYQAVDCSSAIIGFPLSSAREPAEASPTIGEASTWMRLDEAGDLFNMCRILTLCPLALGVQGLQGGCEVTRRDDVIRKA